MNLIFFGTSSFAVPILQALIEKGYLPVAVVTSPDKPIGRKQKLSPSPVKQLALRHLIKIFQPQNLKDEHFLEDFKKLKPDLCVLAAYGKLIPKEYLEIPKHGFINIHPSLLPKYRGPSPIQTAILNGEKETGATIMLMDEELDHGEIISSKKLEVGNKNYGRLERELSELGAKLLIETIPNWTSGKIKPEPQNHAKATYTKKFVWPDGEIDWSKPAKEINRQIRALNPEPGAWTIWESKVLKIIEGEAIKSKLDKADPPFLADGQVPLEAARARSVSLPLTGQVILAENDAIIKCGEGYLIPKRVQLEGRQNVGIKEFINGHRDFIGSVLTPLEAAPTG